MARRKVSIVGAGNVGATAGQRIADKELADVVLIDIAISQDRVIVTENWRDFAPVTRCTALFVRKNWWPSEALTSRVVAAIARWASANPEPGVYARWLDAEFR